MKKKKGLSLIVVVITIIVMIILATAIMLSLTDNKIFDHAEEATNKTVQKQYEQEIATQYALVKNSKEMIGKSNKEVFEETIKKLNIPVQDYNINSRSAVINIDPQNIFTLIEDGDVVKGKFAYLDIADGTIHIESNQYKQGKAEFTYNGSGTYYKVEGDYISYTGDYIITGTSTENMVRVAGAGTYNITLKDLNIDVSGISTSCAFYGNNGIAKGVFVNLYLEGENTLKSNGAGLGFANATPNLNGETEGSTLTIQGEGNLYAEGSYLCAGIGTGYNGRSSAAGNANNIIINSGNITAKAGNNAAAIGGARYKNVNNIVINGGNINAITNDYGPGIGAYGSNSSGTAGILKGLVINGGNLVISGKAAAIGGEKTSEDVYINGGKIIVKNTIKSYSVLGYNCSPITISGGTIIATSTNGTGVGTTDITENINITGGSLYLDVAGDKFAVAPKSGENNVYLTEVALENVVEEILVTSLTTSDKLSYGIKDIYTSTEGKLYVYLPLGERTITIVANGKIYSGQVITSENTQEVVLKAI